MAINIKKRTIFDKIFCITKKRLTKLDRKIISTNVNEKKQKGALDKVCSIEAQDKVTIIAKRGVYS